MTRWRVLVALLAVLGMVAASCGDTTEVTVTSIVTETETVTSVVTETETSIVTEVVPGTTIKFWSTETQPARLQITQDIIAAFTAATDISVELTAADEDNLPSLMITNAAAGTLPDVVFHPIDFTVGWATQGLLNTDASNAVVQNLDSSTFSQGALALATVDGNVAAVPSDGWGQLLVYRQDLFDAAGLDTPDTYANIEAAAAALHDPGNDFYGITASNDGGAVFTQQTFEHFALANGCQLVDDSGTPQLDSDNCVEAIDFYTNLLDNYAPPGLNDVVSTRAAYFAGQASMIVWSPFILDEMAGLRDAALPACDECDDDIAFTQRTAAWCRHSPDLPVRPPSTGRSRTWVSATPATPTAQQRRRRSSSTGCPMAMSIGCRLRSRASSRCVGEVLRTRLSTSTPGRRWRLVLIARLR